MVDRVRAVKVSAQGRRPQAGRARVWRSRLVLFRALLGLGPHTRVSRGVGSLHAFQRGALLFPEQAPKQWAGALAQCPLAFTAWPAVL